MTFDEWYETNEKELVKQYKEYCKTTPNPMHVLSWQDAMFQKANEATVLVVEDTTPVETLKHALSGVEHTIATAPVAPELPVVVEFAPEPEEEPEPVKPAKPAFVFDESILEGIQAHDTGSELEMYRDYAREELEKGNDIENFTDFRNRMNS
jgi:hypothetical protein